MLGVLVNGTPTQRIVTPPSSMILTVSTMICSRSGRSHLRKSDAEHGKSRRILGMKYLLSGFVTERLIWDPTGYQLIDG